MKHQLTPRDYRINFWAFVWHATLLAFSKSFIDTDTVLPALILKAGGNNLLIGLMSAIMVGSAKFMQLFFAPYLASRKSKRLHLLIAINLRVVSIFSLAFLILIFSSLPGWLFFLLLFFIMIVFSWAGSYGGVAYTDLLGKSIEQRQRVSLFSLKQMFQAVGFVSSAYVVKVFLKRFDFPVNYAYSFFTAGVLLLLGSLGFWLLREKYVKPNPRSSIWQFFKLIPGEIRSNANLKYFLVVVNVLGIFFAFTPFLVSYAKQNHILTRSLLGNVLIIKMSGVVIGSLTVYVFKHKIKYKVLLLVAALLTVLVPVAAIYSVKEVIVFESLFFLTGVGFSLMRIANEGILIEISNDSNRSQYAGIVGAANLSGLIFPFVLGGLLSVMSYQAVFWLVALVALVSVFFIVRLNCD